DQAHFYSLMAFGLATLVAMTILEEFYRGGRVISRHTGQNLAAAMLQLTRRNTRRYGGYIGPIGVGSSLICLARVAFNQEKEQELGYQEALNIGHYKLVCQSYTQDDNPNYGSESAILDVYKDGSYVGQLFPQKRFFKSSQQADTIVANHSTLKEDL